MGLTVAGDAQTSCLIIERTNHEVRCDGVTGTRAASAIMKREVHPWHIHDSIEIALPTCVPKL